MKIQAEKIESQKKVHRKTCVRDINFLDARPTSYVISCCIFRLLPPFRLLRFYTKEKVLLQKMVVVGAEELAPPSPSVYGPEESKKGID